MSGSFADDIYQTLLLFLAGLIALSFSFGFFLNNGNGGGNECQLPATKILSASESTNKYVDLNNYLILKIENLKLINKIASLERDMLKLQENAEAEVNK